MSNYSALRLPLSERLPIVIYTNLFCPAAQTVWMTPQVERLTGYRVEDWVGNPGFFEQVLHPDDRRPVLEDVRASRDERRAFSRDYRLIARDGRVVWIHDESVPILDDEGRPELIQGYFIDITERKQLEQQLPHAQKSEALGRLAGEVAHDFNNHLMAVRGPPSSWGSRCRRKRKRRRTCGRSSPRRSGRRSSPTSCSRSAAASRRRRRRSRSTRSCAGSS